MADSTQQMNQNELMTLQHYMKEYGQQAEIFVGQLEMLENGRMEALAAIETLEAMLSADDGVVLLQIGGGASVRAKVLEPDKILLSIGAEVVIEKSNKDAVEFLKELGLKTVRLNGSQCLRIPYYDEAGTEITHRIRWTLGGNKVRRFTSKPGSKVYPYGLERLSVHACSEKTRAPSARSYGK